jgi:lactate dehydrogenase-like 2-hydroxyacid dehydrogenase
MGVALKGKTLGVVGTGKIGLEVIKRANVFGMKVVAFDVFKNEQAAKELGFKYISLEDLASQSHIITLHAPLLDSTKHMINTHIIQKMKEGVILINTARGALIDTKALVNQSTKFRWIGLDVIENEDHFSKENPLLKLSNVIITPHIAFFSDESIKKIAEETERIIKELPATNKVV